MKAKLLFILLSVLFIVPINSASLNTQRRKSHFRNLDTRYLIATRAPIEFDVDMQDVNNHLQIIFLSPLPNAEITITDKDGNIVVYEPQTTISKGKTLFIYTPNAYPYKLKITSPTMEITGEIVEEESE